MRKPRMPARLPMARPPFYPQIVRTTELAWREKWPSVISTLIALSLLLLGPALGGLEMALLTLGRMKALDLVVVDFRSLYSTGLGIWWGSETVTGQFFLSCPALSSCAEAQLALLVLSCSARPKFWWDCPALQDRTGRPAGRTLFLSYIRFVVKYHTNMSPLLPFKQVRFYSFHMRISLPTAL